MLVLPKAPASFRPSKVARELKTIAYFGGRAALDRQLTGFRKFDHPTTPEETQVWFGKTLASFVRTKSMIAMSGDNIDAYNTVPLAAAALNRKAVKNLVDDISKERLLSKEGLLKGIDLMVAQLPAELSKHRTQSPSLKARRSRSKPPRHVGRRGLLGRKYRGVRGRGGREQVRSEAGLGRLTKCHSDARKPVGANLSSPGRASFRRSCDNLPRDGRPRAANLPGYLQRFHRLLHTLFA